MCLYLASSSLISVEQGQLLFGFYLKYSCTIMHKEIRLVTFPSLPLDVLSLVFTDKLAKALPEMEEIAKLLPDLDKIGENFSFLKSLLSSGE